MQSSYQDGGCHQKKYKFKIFLFGDTYKTILNTIQPAITCLKLTIETLGQGVQYVQSWQ